MARDLASTSAGGDQQQVLTAQLDKVIEKYVERKRSHAKLKSMMPNSSMGKKSATNKRRTILLSQGSSTGMS